MTLKALLHKIHNCCIRLRYQPIRVYCLHHACLQFDAEWMNESDWMPIEDFKNKVLALKQDGVTF